jgi:hypothetical protein
MSNELKHADVIVHMAKHGFESVEGRRDSRYEFADPDDRCNPILTPGYEWRIKPATFTYTVTVEPPMRIKPRDGHRYWFIDHGVVSAAWFGLRTCELRFLSGNCWDTEAKAQQAFDALFGPLKAKS